MRLIGRHRRALRRQRIFAALFFIFGTLLWTYILLGES